MEGTEHDSHTMCACRDGCFTDLAQAVLQQNRTHVPTHPAVPAQAPLGRRAQSLLSLRSCGDVREVLWPVS